MNGERDFRPGAWWRDAPAMSPMAWAEPTGNGENEHQGHNRGINSVATERSSDAGPHGRLDADADGPHPIFFPLIYCL
jgi:hypothetical protein